MAEIEKSIDVDVPVDSVYAQWTQFESFPEFMEGVKEVRQLSAERLHWKAEIAGRTEEWDAVITQQAPNQAIGWRSVEGAANAGNVRFEAVDGGTRVHLHLVYEPAGALEKAVDALGFVSRQVESDLERFKRFIESRGRPTGAWEGEIRNPAPEGTRNPQS